MVEEPLEESRDQENGCESLTAECAGFVGVLSTANYVSYMAAIDLNNLGDQPPFVSQFVATCALGKSVRRHLRELTVAADYGSRSFIQIHRSIENGAVLSEIGSAQDQEHYLNFLRVSVRNLGTSFCKERPEVQRILTAIADEAVPFSAGELESHFSELLSNGHLLMTECVNNRGGSAAKARLLEIPSCLPIHIETRSGGHAMTSVTENDGSAIRLLIGEGRNYLSNYLSLDFYFFHELLSHLFPRITDAAGRLSEGHLMAVEEVFFREHSDVLNGGEFTYLSKIVEKDFAAHLNQSGWSSDDGFYRKCGVKVGQLELWNDTRKAVAKLLLEFAAGVGSEVEGISGRERKVLDRLENLALKGNRDSVTAVFSDLDPLEILTQLVSDRYLYLDKKL